MKMLNKVGLHKDTLVIGSGIAGIKTALDASEIGKSVIVIESNTNIGGLLTKLDRTFPTNNCDLCTIAPNVSAEYRNSNIDFMMMTEIVKLTGEVGNFTATLRTSPRYIDLTLCNACGKCKELFPEVINVCPGLDNRAPTCMRYPKITPASFSINIDKCSPKNIKDLVNCCSARAIMLKDSSKDTVVNFGSIVLASGADLFSPEKMDYFGFGKLPNLLTNLEYEQLLSANGPTNGKLIRPSDGGQINNIAWIQCIGSRGEQKGAVPYCSTICCMAALKEAIITKERVRKDIKTTIFYMDMRSCGKEYEQYLNKAKNVDNIRLIRSRPHSLLKAQNDSISIAYSTYDDDTSLKEEIFDMVILSTGFTLNQKNINISNVLGIELNEYGFIKTDEFNSVQSSRPGIYVCGNAESPKDIPHSMIQASAAACLSETYKFSKKSEEKPLLKPILKDTIEYNIPRIGVFICKCGENIYGLINLSDVVPTIEKILDVVFVKLLDYGCNLNSMNFIKDSIRLNNLNRIVIAGCSPKIHESMFRNVIESAGINRNMLEMVNIREQNTWVHSNPDKIEKKAIQLIKSSIYSVLLAEPITKSYTVSAIQKTALVVGGGISGMTAALRLANFGNKVFLIEKMSILGGVSNFINKTINGGDVKKLVKDLIKKVSNNVNIEIIMNAIIVDHNGRPGMFETGVQVGTSTSYMKISHGVTIITTGLLPSRPNKYLLQSHKDVLNQLELEDKIIQFGSWVKKLNTIVMIQCVGSRCDENPECSRICCLSALKNSLALLDKNQDLKIFILYRDIRTEGFYEKYYSEARSKGVYFIHYSKNKPPEVKDDNGLTVEFVDQILGKKVSIKTDTLVLSTGFVVDEENNDDLSTIFKLDRTTSGLFLEGHTKLNPSDFSNYGFFLAGSAHAPKNIQESITQAYAAATRAQTVLSKRELVTTSPIAVVNKDLCATCLACVRVCPFKVPLINNIERSSEIDPSKCHGCGVCVSECPASAIELTYFESNRALAKIKGLYER